MNPASSKPGGVRRRRLERVTVGASRTALRAASRPKAFPRGSRARRRRRDRSRPPSKNDRPPSGGRFGVEPITMSPTAAIVTTPARHGVASSSPYGGGVLRDDDLRRGVGCTRAAATGAGAPSTSNEKTNADRDDDGPALRTSASGRTRRPSCGCRGRRARSRRAARGRQSALRRTSARPR